MFAKDTEDGYGTTTIVLSWLVVISFVGTFIVGASWPTMDVSDPERDYRRLFHMSCGVVVTMLVIARLLWWAVSPSPKPPAGMPAAEYGFSRMFVFFFYIDMLGLGITGFLNSWAMSYEVSFLGLFTLPIFDGPSVMFAGYFHSVFLFMALPFFIFGYVLINLYHSIRYKLGFRRWLPGPQA